MSASNYVAAARGFGGANATNGVINIITRPSYLTDGTLVSAPAGSREQDLSARYGGKIDDETAFRLYGKTFQRAALQGPDGSSAHDNWYRAQGGFRLDRSRVDDTLTVQGDMYRALENAAGQGSDMISGANLLGRWQHRYALSDIQLQAYFDQTESFAPFGGTAFVLHTWDVELQQALSLGNSQKLVWGAGIEGHTYGVEAWARWQVLPWWRLSPGVRTVHEDLRFTPDASGLLLHARHLEFPTPYGEEIPRNVMLQLQWRP